MAVETANKLPDIPVIYDALVFRKAFNILETFMARLSKNKLRFQKVEVAAADFDPECDVCYCAYSGITDITIPLASLMVGRVIYIKKSHLHGSSSDVNINASGSDTIDGYTSVSITSALGCNQLFSDGSNWHIIGDVP